MTETTSPAIESLVGAVNTLPPAERDRVLAWLFGVLSSSAASRGTESLALLGPKEQDVMTGVRPAPLRGSPQVVPVRLGEDQHAALRLWCREHGFTMATVVRGLVDRFLASQDAGAKGRAAG